MRVEDHLKLIAARTGETPERQLSHWRERAAHWDEIQAWADRQPGRFFPGAFSAEAQRHRAFADEIEAHLRSGGGK